MTMVRRFQGAKPAGHPERADSVPEPRLDESQFPEGRPARSWSVSELTAFAANVGAQLPTGTKPEKLDAARELFDRLYAEPFVPVDDDPGEEWP